MADGPRTVSLNLLLTVTPWVTAADSGVNLSVVGGTPGTDQPASLGANTKLRVDDTTGTLILAFK